MGEVNNENLPMTQSNYLGSHGTQILEQNNYYGMTYADTKSLCLDLLKNELRKYEERAALEAKVRHDELLNSFMEKLVQAKISNKSVGEEFQNPDMQFAYIEAQKSYIRRGTKDLEELLSDLLVDRVKETNHSLLQIVLNEAISVVHIILPKQLDALAMCFYLRYTQNNSMSNIQVLISYLKKAILPFATFIDESKKESFFRHLIYVKVGNIEVTSSTLESIFSNSYPGLFCQGYKKGGEIDQYVNRYPTLFMHCLHNQDKVQISVLNAQVLQEEVKHYPKIPEEEISQLKNFLVKNQLSEQEIRNVICEQNPDLKILFNLWNNTSLKSMTLTPVGMMLAMMRIRQVTGEKVPANIWI